MFQSTRTQKSFFDYAQAQLLSVEKSEQQKTENALKLTVTEDLKFYIDAGKKALEEKNYVKAEEQFIKALNIDPMNSEARTGLETAQKQGLLKIEAEKEKQEKDRLTNEINTAWSAAEDLMNRRKYRAAIKAYTKMFSIKGADKSWSDKATAKINECKKLLESMFVPWLNDANELMASNDRNKILEARELCKKILQEDPSYPEAIRCVTKINQKLHYEAKMIYAEALVNESLGAYEKAITLWEHIIKTVPKEDSYHRRSVNKINKYRR